MPKQSILSRIKNNEVLVADGATGTNLIARGLPSGKTPETWIMEDPDQVIQLHKDFINSGADILLTSTFSATPLRLKGSTLEGKSVEVNRKAVELVKEAIGNAPIYIAGSLGPVGQLIKPFGPLEFDEVMSSYSEQARALSEAGVDILVIETQFDMSEIKAAIQGVHEVSNLPVVASLSYDRGRRTMMGVSPSQAGKELSDQPIDLIGINCGRSLEDNLQDLIELHKVTNKPIWFKPNAGLPHLDSSGQTVYDVSPQEMAAQVLAWLAEGALIVGGCCGTSPGHLAEIARRTRRHTSIPSR
jgi:5-methyltetrahydrofolate--homocysteine methyltransferase